MTKHILLILLFVSGILSAQEQLYTEFGLNEGLPSLQVYSIHQDIKGVLWFASDRGIASYNGYEIKQYGINEGLPSLVVLNFYPQDNGTVFCSTFDNKLFFFEKDFKKIRTYPYNEVIAKYIKHQQTINSVSLDKNGNLNIGAIYRNGKLVIDRNGKIIHGKSESNIWSKYNYGIYEQNGKSPLFYTLPDTLGIAKNVQKLKCEDGSHGKITIIRLPKSGTMVFTNDLNLSIFTNDGRKLRSITMKYRPIYIKPLTATTFFVGCLFGGGSIMDTDGNIIQNFLNGQSVTRFLIDREGGYWFTTLYSGVFHVKEPKIKLYKPEIDDISIHALTKNKKNELFINYDSGRIIKIDSANRSTALVASRQPSRSFLEFDELHDKPLLYTKGNLYIDANRFPNPSYILKLSEPTQKGIIACEIGRIQLISINDKSKNTSIVLPFRTHDACYYEDGIYIGSTNGVFWYNTVNGKLKSLKNRHSFFKNRVDDIDYNQKRNELYFASLGSGILIYNKSTETVKVINKEHGLLSNIVNEIYIENDNEIWACTNSGINRILFERNGKISITGLKSSDGLLNDGISDVEIIGKTVWIASKKGLVYAPKSLFTNKNTTFDYLLRVDNILVNNERVKKKSLQNLSYDQNRIEFDFIGMSLKSAGNLTYKYMLEGLDTKWYYSNNRKITYPALPHGIYTLKIAIFDGGKTTDSKQVEIPITIHAPFWKTWWFYLTVFILTGCLIFIFFRFRVLSYNRDITRELLRLLIKKVTRSEKYFVFKENGRNIRIMTNTILYVKSSGNYIELVTENKNYIVRKKIGDFINDTPDPLEYLRIHRSFIVRIDKVESKSKTSLKIKGELIPVSQSYESELDLIFF